MPNYRVHFAATPDAAYPSLCGMIQVDADSPLEAIRRALSQADGPLIGQEQLWARVVKQVLPNGQWEVETFPLAREGTIPVDWR